MKLPYPITYPRTKGRIITRRKFPKRSRIVSFWIEPDAWMRIFETVFVISMLLLGIVIILAVILGITLL